ncbi:MAG: phospholipase D-like domain-containing protein [Bacteroidales bacterium]|nr:phospholipase D-like domain-containing protein [Bacteroidales bacterium]
MIRWKYLNKYNTAEELSLITSGNDFYNQIEDAINKAISKINLQFYLFDYDTTGKRIIDALIKAAERGVKVFVLLDAFGSKAFPDEVVTEMRNCGIKIRFFSPLLSFKRISLGRRMHHKLVEIDSETAFIGGINIADKYRDTPRGKGWLDFAVKVKGKVVGDAHQICKYIWSRRVKRKHLHFSENKENPNAYFVKFCENDWFMNKNNISAGYKNAIKHSKESITIVGAYFLPGRQFRKILRRAAERGVAIRIILSRTSDVKLSLYASRFLYDWLFRNKIKIYEWKDSVVHGKVAIVDNVWTTIGSFNLNYLSVYGSLELNLNVYNEQFSSGFNKKIDEIIETGCIEVVKDEYEKKINYLTRFKLWFSFYFIRFLMLIIVLLTTNPEKK